MLRGDDRQSEISKLDCLHLATSYPSARGLPKPWDEGFYAPLRFRVPLDRVNGEEQEAATPPPGRSIHFEHAPRLLAGNAALAVQGMLADRRNGGRLGSHPDEGVVRPQIEGLSGLLQAAEFSV